MNPSISQEQLGEGAGEQSRSATPINNHPYASMDDEQKDFYAKSMKLKYQALLFKNDEFLQKAISFIHSSTVIKYSRIWQSLFYILKINREAVCEPDSNKLKWKLAKNLLSPKSNLWDLMNEYEAVGQKDDEYREYQSINFIERNIENYYVEDADAYQASLVGRVMRWVQAAVKLRRADIVRRKALFRRAKELREEAIVNEQKRKERLDVELVEAEVKFKEDNKDEIEAYQNYQQKSNRESEGDQDESAEKEAAPVLPVFNKEAFLTNWLNLNPPFIIPDEPIEELDNDWIMTQSELDYNVNTYLGRE